MTTQPDKVAQKLREYIELGSKATSGPWEWWYEDKEQSDIVRTSSNGNQWEENIICRDSGVYPPDVPTCEFIIASRTMGPKCAEALLVAMEGLETYCTTYNDCNACKVRKRIESLFAESL